MKRTISLLLVAAMLLLALAGCNTPGTDTESPSAPASSTPPANSTQPTDPDEEFELVTITLPTYRSGEDVGAKLFLPQVERFNQMYEGRYHIIIEESPGTTHSDKIKALAQNGKLPPVFQFAEFTYARDNWFNDDYLYDMSDWLNSTPDLKNVFVPAGMDFVTTDSGAIYAIPLAVVRPTGTFVNNNVFNPDKPLRDMSWDELGAALADAGTTYGFMTLEGAWTLNLTVVAIMASQNGGVDILQNGLNETISDFNTPEWVETFTVLKKLYDDCGWADGIGKAYPASENAFVNNQIGVLPNGQWIISVFDPAGEGAANWGEGFDGTKVTGDIFPGNVAIANPCVYDWYISANCTEGELALAKAFIEFISSPAELEAFMLAEGGSAPMITYSQSFLDELAENKLMSDFASAVNADTKYVPYLHEIWPGSIMDANGAFTANLPLLLDGSLTPQEFCAALTIAATE